MISSSRSLRPLSPRFVAAALLACASALLPGCSGTVIADRMPAAIGGLPENAPERAVVQGTYPPVHSLPPSRANATLSDVQQKQLEDDLVTVRNRYGSGPEAPSATGSTANPKAGSAPNP